jgi:hypothetical protein
MQSFLTRHQPNVKGVLSGLDRIRFRGTVRWLSSWRGMMSFLGTIRVLLKDFGRWSSALTEDIKRSTEKIAAAAGRPIIYLHSSQIRKELYALNVAAEDHITEGLICVLTCVEPCYSFRVGGNRQTRLLELHYGPSKCLHQYFYWQHPQLGLVYLRLQTWLPLTVHIGLNGREWLANQLRAEQIPFEQRDNCFVDVGDVNRAQQLLDRQLNTNWSRLLDGLRREVHPVADTLYRGNPLNYYWSADETEHATDVMFLSQEALDRCYPRLVRQAVTTFGSDDVLRFLGRCPHVRHYQTSEICTTLKTRPEGTRVKHQLNSNSVKMYNKQQTVLRIETTINDPRDLKVLRSTEGQPEKGKRWQRLRKGVADLHRRTKVSQQTNERYLEALAAVDQTASLAETVHPVCQPTRWKRRRVRGLQPFQPQDAAVLAAIARAEFLLHGFRNRDLRPLLFGERTVTARTARSQSAKITRMIRMLRAHGLVRKIPKSHRYQLTDRGRNTVTALIAAKHASVQRLTELAV